MIGSFGLRSVSIIPFFSLLIGSLALRDETFTYFEIVSERPFGLENLIVKRPLRLVEILLRGFSELNAQCSTRNILLERAVL